MATRTFSRLYDSYDDAAHVVGALEAAGIPSDDISLVANRSTGDRGDPAYPAGTVAGPTASVTTPAGTVAEPLAGPDVTDADDTTETGAGTGATLGTILGGGAGLLAGLGMLAIPGVGPIVAAGWLIATITGAGVGAAAGGLLGSLVGAGVDEADAHVYAEGVRRGGALVTVRADESQAGRIEALLAGRTSVDPAARRAEWETTGWSGFDETAPHAAAAVGTAATGREEARPTDLGLSPRGRAGQTHTVDAGADKTLHVVEERLVVGKREVDQGAVRVQAKVVETPVQEQVRLHEERVTLERHPVDRPADPADVAGFQGRTIEARAHGEEAVIAKEARVVEEIGIRKDVADRVETVRDTVRHTEVDVQDTTGRSVAATAEGKRPFSGNAAPERTDGLAKPGTPAHRV